MADIEKMREIFEESLKTLGEVTCLGEGFTTERMVADLRARFNEAVMANQDHKTFVTVNNSGVPRSEVEEMVKEAVSKLQRELKLASVS